jgi:hypothetical protein
LIKTQIGTIGVSTWMPLRFLAAYHYFTDRCWEGFFGFFPIFDCRIICNLYAC